MSVVQLVEVLPREGKWSWLSKRVDAMLSKGQLLVFVNSSENAEELEQNFTDFLDKNAGNVHDGLDTQECMRIVLAFQKGELDVLVATDIAAVFGLENSSNVTVVSYDPPRDIVGHTHRIGFASGAGGAVEAYTLLHDDDDHTGIASSLVEHFKQINLPISEGLQALADRRAVKFLKSDTPQVSQTQLFVVQGKNQEEEVDSDEDLMAPGVRSAFAPELRPLVDSKSNSQRVRTPTAVQHSAAVTQSHTLGPPPPPPPAPPAPPPPAPAAAQSHTLGHGSPSVVQQSAADAALMKQSAAEARLIAQKLGLVAEQGMQMPVAQPCPDAVAGTSANTLAPAADQLRPDAAPCLNFPMGQRTQESMQMPFVQTSTNMPPLTIGQLCPDAAPPLGPSMQQLAMSGGMQQPVPETAAGTLIPSALDEQCKMQVSAPTGTAAPSGSAPETLADQAATGQWSASGVALAGRTTSAGWSRFKEDDKYTIPADTNVNPKHVGGSLRTLTLEDRLELRRKSRALAKTGAIAGGEINDTSQGQVGEISTEKLDVTRDGTKQTLQEIADDDDDDVVFDIGGCSCPSGRPEEGTSDNVDLTISDSANTAQAGHSTSSGKPLEVFDIAASASDANGGNNNVVEHIEDLEVIVPSDNNASAGAAARRAQRKRKKADACAAEAEPPAQVQCV